MTFAKKNATFRALIAAAVMACAGMAGAQAPLFTENFDKLNKGERPSEGWLIVGALDDPFWFGDNGGLNTGNLDDFSLGNSFAIIDKPESARWRNVKLSADIDVLQAEGAIAIAIRVKDLKNYYFAVLKSGPASDGSGTLRAAELFKMVNSVPRQIAASPKNVALPEFESDGISHKLSFEANGSKLTLYLDDKELVSATDIDFEQGAAGIGGAYTQVIFDNVKVEAVGDPLMAVAPGGEGDIASQSAGMWRVLVVSDLREADARKQAATLQGYNQVEVLPRKNLYAVYIGAFPSRDAARQSYEKLENEGVVLEGFEFVPEKTTAPVPVADSGENFRVIVGSFTRRDDAKAKKSELETLGIYPVDIEEDGSNFRVLAGYPFSSSDAEKYAADLRRLGQTSAASIKTGGSSAAPELDFTALEAEAERSGPNVSPEERAQVLALILKMEEQKKGRSTFSDQEATNSQVGRMNDQMKALLQKLQQQREENATHKDRVKAVSDQFETARAAKKFDEALNLIDEWIKLEPENAALASMRRELINQKSLFDSTSQREDEVSRQIAAMKVQAEAAEKGGNLQESLKQWRLVKSTALTQAQQDAADREISRLSLMLLKAAPTGESSSGAGLSGPALVGAIVLVGLVIIGGVVILVSRKQRPKGGMQPMGSPMPHAPASPIRPGAALPIVPPTPVPVKTAVVAAEERIRPGVVNPAPGAATRPAAAAPKTPVVNAPTPVPAPSPAAGPSDTIALDGVMTAGPAPVADPATPLAPKPVPAPAHAAPATPQASPPTPLRPQVAPQTPPHTPPNTPVPQPVPVSDISPISASGYPEMSSGEFAMPPMPDSSPVLFKTPLPVAPTGSMPPGYFYAQDFADEVVGKPPRNWKGSHDYASLLVAARDGGGKCMRFDKRSDKGSTYYSCRFPDASGRVVVEFDLCCLDKNKYLLGFYIEKDEDFRHAVHTVVHKDTSKTEQVSLRLQNDAAPYKLGQWVHIRYLIDLPRHLVDGFVDGKPVAEGVRLVSRPKVMNTLSIRDNLATEGTLMIGNIRIYRDS